MGWIIYNSKGEPLVTQEQHDHTATDASGPMTNDEHDGYSEYDEIAAPAAPAANKLRTYVKDVGGASLPLFQNSEGIETTLMGIGRPLRTTFWSYSEMMDWAAIGHTGVLDAAVTGAGCAWTNKAAEASHPGIWVGNTGTTATGHARLSSAQDGIMFSNGRVRLGVWIKTGATISGAVNRWHLYAGVIDNPDPTVVAEGMMIRYRDNQNGGKWQGVVANGGGWTTLDLGIVVAINTWYFLEMEANAAGDNVEFFIDGVSKGSIASGPAANATAEVRSGILKSAGILGRDADWDAYYLEGEFTTAR